MKILLLAATLFLFQSSPITAATNRTSCASLNGWTSKLGVGTGGGNIAERTFTESFRRGDVLTFHLNGFESGVIIEVPSGNLVASYPYGLYYLTTSFTYTIPQNGINSVKITLRGYDLYFTVNCRPKRLIIITEPPPIPPGVRFRQAVMS